MHFIASHVLVLQLLLYNTPVLHLCQYIITKKFAKCDFYIDLF
nr:MAG TPA: hypothetical protein [Caudoviricetes sp.]